jgi:hypothetical protein
MFDYRIVDLPRIAIIGKEGLCTKEKNIVQDLWQQANSNFSDIADLGMKYADGSFVGFWGAMSDETMSFMPWTDGFSRGLYLAGVEVYEDTAVPDGWVKWVVPARKYLVTEVQPEKYIYAFQLWRTKSRGPVWTLVQAILYTIFGIAILGDLAGGAVSLSWMLGIYCLVSAFFLLIDTVREWLGTVCFQRMDENEFIRLLFGRRPVPQNIYWLRRTELWNSVL